MLLTACMSNGNKYYGWYCMVGNFHGYNFHGLGSSDNFVSLYFRGVPTVIT